MLSSKFRPWGDFLWVIEKIPPLKWSFLGCLSTEDRCLTAMQTGSQNQLLTKADFIHVTDPPSILTEIISKKIEDNRSIIINEKGLNYAFTKMELLSADEKIYDVCKQFIDNQQGNVILDISSFPKRYFFPFIKLLIADDTVKNLLVTYTEPETYSKADLSDDPEPWYPLPLFMSTEHPEPQFELAIVGTGFMPFSLPKLLKDKHSEISLRLFFPFPPGPPNYQRAWEFVRKIEKYYTFKDTDSIVRVNSLDVNGTFNYICYATDEGNRKCIFAPYGPKPISLAICIFASLNNSPVYYTQPKYYNPEYSIGVRNTMAYCIKLNGENLFL